jgi:hypothetical protein
MMGFDFLLDKENNKTEFKELIEDFLKGLEDIFQALVYEGGKHLAFYRERKRDCLDVISKYIHD